MEIGSPAYWSIFATVHIATLVLVLPLVSLIRIAYRGAAPEAVAKIPYGLVVVRELIIVGALAVPVARFGADAFRFWEAVGESWSGLITQSVLLVAALSPLGVITAIGNIRRSRQLLDRRRQDVARMAAAMTMADTHGLKAVMANWYERFDQPPSPGELLDEARLLSEHGSEPTLPEDAARTAWEVGEQALQLWDDWDSARRQVSSAELIAAGRVAIVHGPIEWWTVALLTLRGVRILVHVELPDLALARLAHDTTPMSHPEIWGVIAAAGEQLGKWASTGWVLTDGGARLTWSAVDGRTSTVDPRALASAAGRASRPGWLHRIARVGRRRR